MTANEKLDLIEAEVEEEVKHGLINEEKKKHADNEPADFSVKFQIIATSVIILCALAGGALGIIFSNIEASEELVSWFALPGDLFIRALRCAVLPLVFVNVIIAVLQMIEAGKAGAVGKYTVLVYLMTTFIASLEGLLAVLVFQSQFTTDEEDEEKTFINLNCPTDGLVLVQQGNTVSCDTIVEANETLAQFEVNNTNDFFVTSGNDFTTFTFSETLQNGIFKNLVSDNIVAEFANGGFVGVVMFGIIFGAASAALKRKPVLLLQFLEDVNDILITIITWIIYLTPFAVFSLITGALASQEDLADTFANIGILVAASVTAIVTHLTIVYPGIFFFFVRQNPYAYMRFILPAQIFAFSCASSAATLPITMKCVKASGQVPDSVRDFVLPIGATVNMDGTALYFPPALIFLAKTAGFDSGVTEFFLIVLVSTIGSAGAAPVPNAGLVLIITAFNTVYGGNDVPPNFAIIVGIDWLMDRFQTALNITGDAMVSRIVTKLSGLDIKPGQPTSEMPVDEED